MSYLTGVNDIKSKPRLVETLNYLDGKYKNDIGREIREGLSASQKYIPCKYFYEFRYLYF